MNGVSQTFKTSRHEGALPKQDPWVDYRDISSMPGERAKKNIHGDALGMDGSQVGVFEERDEVRLSRLLKSHDRGRLEAQVRLQQ